MARKIPTYGIVVDTPMEENIREMDVRDVLKDNYLPYAMSVIMNRAIPAIDGLKPVHRHILYTMWTMGLLKGGKIKSSNIVGQTMKFHPHGDGAIYETMVRMTTGNGSLNAPYVESKGSMGRVESRDMAYAAHRYTEAKLAPICAELFDGIDEDAVDMVDNYDATAKEPVLLPVKFPSLIVNTAPGIAVGMSSSMPSYNLKDVCLATIGIIKGEITTPKELHKVLGAPDFSTGGTIHGTDKEFTNILKTGRGSIMMSGTVELGRNKIVVTKVPYSTTIEAIMDDVKKYVKSGQLKEISDIRDESDINGTRIAIDLKRGADVDDVLKRLFMFTRLRTSMGVNNNVLVNGKPMTLGVLDTLKEWIKFRMTTVGRIYSYRLNKAIEREELLSAWEKISGNLQRAVEIITKNNEDNAKVQLAREFSLTDKQVDYLLDMRVKDLTVDKMNKKLADLKQLRENIEHYKKIVADDSEKEAIIIDELTNIAKKYGHERNSLVSDVPIDNKVEKIVDDRVCYVYATAQGYIKRVENIKRSATIEDMVEMEKIFGDDQVVFRSITKNCEHILVFLTNGSVYKIPVINIESSKGLVRDNIGAYIEDIGNGSATMIYMRASNGYDGELSVFHKNGLRYIVKMSHFSGNRKKYISCYAPGTAKDMWVTTEKDAVVISKYGRAVYSHGWEVTSANGISKTNVGRLTGDDEIIGIQPLSRIPDIENVDLERLKRPYFVKIRERLW